MQMFLDITWGDINNGDVGPGMFSWFHFLCLAITIVVTIVVCVTVALKQNPKYDRIVVGVCALIMICCEVFKQLFWFEFYGYYRFEIFPFQFCSVPIYVATAATLIPSEKIRSLLYKFLGFYGIIGGLAVMVVPSAVLYTYFIPMSIHAMLWHGTLIVLGAYLIVSRDYGSKLRELVAPSLMLLGFVIIAIIGNVLVYNLHLNTPNCQPGDNLSMFYISPYYPTQLPLLGMVQEISYPLFVVCYLLFFNLFSVIVWCVSKLLRRTVGVALKNKKNKEIAQQ